MNRRVVYPLARAIVVIDGEPVELTPDDPRWREQGLHLVHERVQEHLERSMVETQS